MDITVKFDQDQYTSVRQDYGMPVLDTNTFNAQTLFPARNSAAVADTGASVDCSWIEMLKMMGIGRRLLLPSSTVLCTANKQRMTVMGLVPVIIGAGNGDVLPAALTGGGDILLSAIASGVVVPLPVVVTQYSFRSFALAHDYNTLRPRFLSYKEKKLVQLN